MKDTNMSEQIVEVQELPELNQGLYPHLFDSPAEGDFLFQPASSLQSLPKEIILGGIITVTARAGKWCPVDADDIIKSVGKVISPALSIESLASTILDLADDKELDLMKYQNKIFVVPSPGLIARIDRSKLCQW